MLEHQMFKRYSGPPKKVVPIPTAEEIDFSKKVQGVVTNLQDGPSTSRRLIPYKEWRDQGPKEILVHLSPDSLRSGNPSYIMSDVVRESLLAIMALGICARISAAFMAETVIPTGILATLKSGGTYFISF